MRAMIEQIERMHCGSNSKFCLW